MFKLSPGPFIYILPKNSETLIPTPFILDSGLLTADVCYHIYVGLPERSISSLYGGWGFR